MKLLRVFRIRKTSSWGNMNPDDPVGSVGPTVISVLILTIGFLFWFTVVFTFVPFTLDLSRELWLGREPGGLSLLEAYSIVCLLLGYWLFFDLFRFWWNGLSLSFSAGVAYLACVVVLAAIGRNLYVMNTTLLDNSWYEWVSETEESALWGSYYLGRISESHPKECGDAPRPCIAVELTNGRFVKAFFPEKLVKEPFEIVAVALVSGEITKKPRYYEVVAYIPGDTEMRWGQIRE